MLDCFISFIIFFLIEHLSKREIPILKVNTEIIDRRKEEAHKIAQLKELGMDMLIGILVQHQRESLSYLPISEEMHEVGVQLGWGPEETERQLGIGRYAKNAHHAAAPAGDAHAAPAAHH